MATTTIAAITWNTQDLSLDLIRLCLGSADVDRILAARDTGHCRSRAAGWWDANDHVLHAAYRSLEQIIIEAERARAFDHPPRPHKRRLRLTPDSRRTK